jgi:hypothetical protein
VARSLRSLVEQVSKLTRWVYLLKTQQEQKIDAFGIFIFSWHSIIIMSKRNIEQVTKLFTDLFPVTRSLTGDGVRQTLERLSDVTQLNVGTVPSGTSVYDGEVPPE